MIRPVFKFFKNLLGFVDFEKMHEEAIKLFENNKPDRIDGVNYSIYYYPSYTSNTNIIHFITKKKYTFGNVPSLIFRNMCIRNVVTIHYLTYDGLDPYMGDLPHYENCVLNVNEKTPYWMYNLRCEKTVVNFIKDK